MSTKSAVGKGGAGDAEVDKVASGVAGMSVNQGSEEVVDVVYLVCFVGGR